MYSFILGQWKLCKYDEQTVLNCVAKGYITQEQADTILATPRNCG